jgi:hypothetical protein
MKRISLIILCLIGNAAQAMLPTLSKKTTQSIAPLIASHIHSVRSFSTSSQQITPEMIEAFRKKWFIWEEKEISAQEAKALIERSFRFYNEKIAEHKEAHKLAHNLGVPVYHKSVFDCAPSDGLAHVWTLTSDEQVSDRINQTDPNLQAYNKKIQSMMHALGKTTEDEFLAGLLKIETIRFFR